jgi:hypothetical protein
MIVAGTEDTEGTEITGGAEQRRRTEKNVSPVLVSVPLFLL